MPTRYYQRQNCCRPEPHLAQLHLGHFFLSYWHLTLPDSMARAEAEDVFGNPVTAVKLTV